MVTHTLTAMITVFIDLDQYVHIGAVKFFKAVKLVGAFPLLGKTFRCNKVLINYIKHTRLHIRECIMNAGMIVKIATHQSSIPSPIIFSICRSMNTHIATACLYISFESSFLPVIEHIAGCT